MFALLVQAHNFTLLDTNVFADDQGPEQWPDIVAWAKNPEFVVKVCVFLFFFVPSFSILLLMNIFFFFQTDGGDYTVRSGLQEGLTTAD